MTRRGTIVADLDPPAADAPPVDLAAFARAVGPNVVEWLALLEEVDGFLDGADADERAVAGMEGTRATASAHVIDEVRRRFRELQATHTVVKLREVLDDEIAAHEAARGTEREASAARAVAATRRAVEDVERRQLEAASTPAPRP